MLEKMIFFSFCCLKMTLKLRANFRDNSCRNIFLQELFKPAQEVAVVTLNQPRLHIACSSHNDVFFGRERTPVNHPLKHFQSPLVILRPSVKTNSKPCRHAELSLPLGSGEVTWAGGAIPGTVRVPCKATLSTSFSIHITAVQRKLWNSSGWANVELLLL